MLRRWHDNFNKTRHLLTLIERVIHSVVRQLFEKELLVLVEGATVETLTTVLLSNLENAPSFAQVGSFIGTILVNSPQVEELYADDREIIERVNESL